MPLVDRGTRAVFVRGRYRVNKRSMHASSYSRLFVQMLSARLNNTLKTKGTKVDTARLNFTERLLPADWIPPKPILTQINQSGNHVTSGNVSVLLFVKYRLCDVITVIIIWTPTHPPPHTQTQKIYTTGTRTPKYFLSDYTRWLWIRRNQFSNGSRRRA